MIADVKETLTGFWHYFQSHPVVYWIKVDLLVVFDSIRLTKNFRRSALEDLFSET